MVSKIPYTREIIVAKDSDHPAPFSENFFTGDPHWIIGFLTSYDLGCQKVLLT